MLRAVAGACPALLIGATLVLAGGTPALVSWRLLGTDPDAVAFHVYRDGVRVAGSPVTGATNLLDPAGTATSSYTVAAVHSSVEQPPSAPVRRCTAMGRNVRSGPHYTQFLVYDLDGDGRAEMVARTADGTTDGTGRVIGNGAADHRNADGHVLAGPEFLTVFDGRTGAALNTTNYEPGWGDPCAWGDCRGNRSDRFLAAVAYLDGERPSFVMARSYYTRTVLVAYDWRDGRLTRRWTFDTNTAGNGAYAGQGNHNLSVGDVDGDGRDEIGYGSMAVDDTGTGRRHRAGHGRRHSQALRLYATGSPTPHRIRTLMHDPIYRLGVAWQNVGYNQPPHTSFFLGTGMAAPPPPNVVTAPR